MNLIDCLQKLKTNEVTARLSHVSTKPLESMQGVSGSRFKKYCLLYIGICESIVTTDETASGLRSAILFEKQGTGWA